MGVLNALNSEITIDVKEFENVTNMKNVEIEQIEKVKTFIKEEIKEPKIKDIKEAEKIANYKAKYIFPGKEFFLANFNLINMPVWTVNIRKKNYIISGIDEKFPKKLLADLQKDFPKVKTHSDIFEESLKDIKKPHVILGDFWKILKTSNKLVVLIILILIILVVIFIIKKIALKI